MVVAATVAAATVAAGVDLAVAAAAVVAAASAVAEAVAASAAVAAVAAAMAVADTGKPVRRKPAIEAGYAVETCGPLPKKVRLPRQTNLFYYKEDIRR
jgi:hypothetical protein